jgi:copper(I)-binding protein
MGKTQVVGVRLDQAHRHMLAEMAKRNGVTMSMQARMILVAAFRNVAINGVGLSKEES